MFTAIIVATSLQTAPAPADGSSRRCEGETRRFLALADAANRLKALEFAEHEVGVQNRSTSVRLTAARLRGEESRRALLAMNCSAATVVPALSRYMPPARACATAEQGGEPGPEFAGCDPFVWRP